MNQQLDSFINFGKAENFDILKENGFSAVIVEDEPLSEFLGVLKEGVKLLVKIYEEGAHEHDYNEYYSDTSQIYPLNEIKSNLIFDDGYDSENPESYLEIIHLHDGYFNVIQCSFRDPSIENTVIDCLGHRYIACDSMNNLNLSNAVYAALLDFWMLNKPSAYDMPFVIDLLFNQISPFEKSMDIVLSFTKALTQDLTLIESNLTFSKCYSKDIIEDEPLFDSLPM